MINLLENITFASPQYFWFATIIVPMIIWYMLRHSDSYATLRISTLDAYKSKQHKTNSLWRHILFVNKILLVLLFVTMIASPQTTSTNETSKTEGIDIVLAIDVSSSMLAMDFDPNRMDASKNISAQFISGRPNDRMGLVAFSGESYTLCPLTTDHATLKNLLMSLKEGIIEDGTAIGLGLGTAISRLKDSNSPSKVVILLTDGVNNAGELAPLTAAELAVTYGIKVYTIGVGNNGYANMPVNTFAGVQYQKVEVKIDEEVLQKISALTGGKYFRATNEQKLIEIYQEIDKLEKMEIEIKKTLNVKEEFFWFAMATLIIIVLDILIKNLIIKTIP